MTRKVPAKLSYVPTPNLAGMYAEQAAQQAKAGNSAPEGSLESEPVPSSEPEPPPPATSKQEPRKRAKKPSKPVAPSPKTVRAGSQPAKPDLRVRRTIRIPKAAYLRLQAIAERRGIPINALILAALADTCQRS